jgi:hypothetical protein
VFAFGGYFKVSSWLCGTMAVTITVNSSKSAALPAHVLALMVARMHLNISVKHVHVQQQKLLTLASAVLRVAHSVQTKFLLLLLLLLLPHHCNVH